MASFLLQIGIFKLSNTVYINHAGFVNINVLLAMVLFYSSWFHLNFLLDDILARSWPLMGLVAGLIQQGDILILCSLPLDWVKWL